MFCDTCFNISDAPLCPICRDPGRDDGRLCVVEEPLDVLAIERTGEYRGRYHVLHGAISPIDGIGPDRLKVRELLGRVDEAKAAGEMIEEVIIATNPTLEGEATAMYLGERLAGRVGRDPHRRGLPVGGDLEYADDVTLVRALQGRRELEVTPSRSATVSYLVFEALLRLVKPLVAARAGGHPLLARDRTARGGWVGAPVPGLLDSSARAHPAARDGAHLPSGRGV